MSTLTQYITQWFEKQESANELETAFWADMHPGGTFISESGQTVTIRALVPAKLLETDATADVVLYSVSGDPTHHAVSLDTFKAWAGVAS